MSDTNGNYCSNKHTAHCGPAAKKRLWETKRWREGPVSHPPVNTILERQQERWWEREIGGGGKPQCLVNLVSLIMRQRRKRLTTNGWTVVVAEMTHNGDGGESKSSPHEAAYLQSRSYKRKSASEQNKENPQWDCYTHQPSLPLWDLERREGRYFERKQLGLDWDSTPVTRYCQSTSQCWKNKDFCLGLANITRLLLER